jgi:hypothetical protein
VPINDAPLRSGGFRNRHLRISEAVNAALASKFFKGYLVEFAEGGLHSYHQPPVDSTVVFAALTY